jgi:C_GCAxxG_C_C family probable redox protein
METISIADVRKSAEDSFSSGLYCAESVILAIARAKGEDSELLPRLATALCSGMSRSCGPCGALTGALLGVGLVLGRSTPDGSVEPAYTAARQVIREFEQEFGSRDCHALLGGIDLNTLEGQTLFTQQNLGERCCQITGKAAEIAARIIFDSNG